MSEDHALPIVRTVAALRAHTGPWREKRLSLALTPTMGALHEGHLSLVRLARRQADKVVVSIFVNPRQFGAGEDFETYPRQEMEDVRRLAAERCDLIYAPTAPEMYPPGFGTTVAVPGLSEVLCGASRPGHFDGVATVVAKLLIQAAPDVAIFGEKDYQQLQLIRRLARDLDLKVEILGGATFRAPDGLALSSRNAYLSEAERAKAPHLHTILREAARALAAGEAVAPVEARAREALARAGFDKLDYLETRSGEALTREGPGPAGAGARVFGAAWLGKTRLIDNMAVG